MIMIILRLFYFILEKWFIAGKINYRVRREHRALTLFSVYSAISVVSQTKKISLISFKQNYFYGVYQELYNMGSIQSPYKELLDDLLAGLKKEWGENLISLVVYGSVAREDNRKDSDIDILIVCKSLPTERFRRQELFIDVEKGMDMEGLYKKGYYPDFSPILKTMQEAESLSPLYLDMVDDAVILYDAGGFFSNVLDRLSKGLKKMGARKIWLGRKWYWDLKPDFKHGEVVIIE